MSRLIDAIRKVSWIEQLGIFICGSGLCLAFGFVGYAFDHQRAIDEKPRIQQSVDEMRSKLIAANVPEDQILGLVQIHKSALVAEAVHEIFINASFLFLVSLIFALFGFSLVLWSKIRALCAAKKTMQATAATPRS